MPLLPQPFEQAICDGTEPSSSGSGAKRLAALGQLMDESHASCRDLYDCSAPPLDDLVGVCKGAGAIGSRLTGAGWGGCCVSLVPEEGVEAFIACVRERYYQSEKGRADVVSRRPEESYLFKTRPGDGAKVFSWTADQAGRTD